MAPPRALNDIGYLGPPGTFTHQAALQAGYPPASLRAIDFNPEIIAAVDCQQLAAGVVALENSLEGVVGSVLDELLLNSENCLIRQEIVLPISFNLFRHPDDRQPLLGVASHRVALGQCSQFISEQGLEQRETTSTAAACQQLAERPEPGWGALGPELAGSIYRLRPSEWRVENNQRPRTRFVVIGPECPPPSGNDRTALALSPPRDESGSLMRRLEVFARRKINLTTIRSRSWNNALGNYIFFLECQGHINDQSIGAAFQELLALPGGVRFLGSFPSKLEQLTTAAGQEQPFLVDESLDLIRGKVGK